jgi:hypothetical protein
MRERATPYASGVDRDEMLRVLRALAQEDSSTCPKVDEIKAEDLLGDYPAVRYCKEAQAARDRVTRENVTRLRAKGRLDGTASNDER